MIIRRPRYKRVTKVRVTLRKSRGYTTYEKIQVPITRQKNVRIRLKNGRYKVVPKEIVYVRTYHRPVHHEGRVRPIAVRYKDIELVGYKERKLFFKRNDRASWGEHGYTCEIVKKSQVQGSYAYWTNYPDTLHPNWTRVGATAEQLGGPPSTTWEWSSNDDIALIGKLRNKVLGSDFHAGKFLAEGHQALDMITNFATRIYRSYRAMKKGDVGRAMSYLADARPLRNKGSSHIPTRHPELPPPVRGSSGKSPSSSIDGRKTAANNWLEWQYGVLPLLSDTKAAAEALAQQLNFGIRKRYSVTLNRPSAIRAGSPAYGYNGYAVAQGRLIAIISEVNFPQLSGLTDVASAAWEVTPWSFVADWFLPIGNYLEARGAAQALSGTFVTTVTKRLDARNLFLRTHGSSVEFDVLPCQFFTLTLTRSVSTELSVPMPSVVPLNKALSWRRAANAVALITQRMRS